MDHLTDHEFNAYRARDLAPEALLRVTDHLADCGDCRARLRQEAQTGGTLAELRQSFERISQPRSCSVSPAAICNRTSVRASRRISNRVLSARATFENCRPSRMPSCRRHPGPVRRRGGG